MQHVSTESPCIGACRLDPQGRACLGCGRTLREITRWRDLSDEERRRVNARLAGFVPGGGSAAPRRS
ncbi:MAG TPA: DUF1289 domain-containing protein [Beijerinckiaceae bacterium]|nr:DUF1289 domain-containing protein [Beijerinckiaceae bacterium]